MTQSRLPKVEQAVVPEAKVVGYLLNILHPKGRSKARFFLLFGFTREKWTVLADALREHAQTNPLSAVEEDPEFGIRYVVEGEIDAPDGRRPRVRVVWFIDAADVTRTPRLVTAYPLEENDD
jgi:hypothetical protein